MGEKKVPPGSGKLPKIAKARGQTVEGMMEGLIAAYKTPVLVANVLGVYPNTVRHWLVTNGYRSIDKQWVKVEEV